jgi:glycosyltransferase involved in cell wall biosynthesis
MIDHENIPVKKITHINLAYDFSLYTPPNEQKVREIRNQFKAVVLLLSVCRLTAFKRPNVAIHTVKELTDQGLDVKLILLGNGEMQDELERLIAELGLQNKVFMPGYVSNVVEYMAAADFFVHPSLLDSSCVTVKEAGLVKLPVIVCRGIGDFDDYLIHEKNGFLVEKDKFVEDSAEIIKLNFQNDELLRNIGENLRKSVLELFSIEHVIERYNALNNPR